MVRRSHLDCTHLQLTPYCLHNTQVIELNVSTVSSDPNKTVDITHLDSAEVRFSYSVKWVATETPFSDRMDRYSRYSFLPQHLEVGPGGSVVVQGIVWLSRALCSCVQGRGAAGTATRATHSCGSTWRWVIVCLLPSACG